VSLRARTTRVQAYSRLIGRQISIGTFPTRLEAETAQGLLASAGISAVVASDDAGGAYPFDLSGGAQLLVEDSDFEAAARVLADRTDAL
jgi:Putative prokaryotic signal transducing protein